jgi:hypothetical protein
MTYYLVSARGKPKGEVLMAELALQELCKGTEGIRSFCLIREDLFKRRAIRAGAVGSVEWSSWHHHARVVLAPLLCMVDEVVG